MPAHIDLVTIFTTDVAKTRDFYVDLLGFEVVDPFTSPDGSFVWLRSKKRSSSIAIQDSRRRNTKPTQAGIPTASGGLMLGFVVEDAEAAYNDWKDKGVTFRTDVVDMGKGMTFGVKDPAGNYLQIFDVHPKFQELQKQMGLD